jgi:hypothetical protein
MGERVAGNLAAGQTRQIVAKPRFVSCEHKTKIGNRLLNQCVEGAL